jgi:hypothetical protein
MHRIYLQALMIYFNSFLFWGHSDPVYYRVSQKNAMEIQQAVVHHKTFSVVHH